MFPETTNPRNIMIVAGEASGDLHGSNLVKEIHRIDSSIRFYGIGGKKLKEAGVELIAGSSDMAVVGLTEVVFKLKFILKVMGELKKLLREDKPDLLILIDYPDFNLLLARTARKNGVRVFYYISPQVWAWRKRRIKQIEKIVDRMAVILPFEAQVYDKSKLDVSFVGHPLLDAVKKKYSRKEALKKFGLEEGFITIGILPGSRESEAKELLPEMLKAAEILKHKFASIQFVLPLADTLSIDFVLRIIDQHPVEVRVIRDDIYDVIGISDIVMVASGTATLETALLETPMVIIYKVSTLSYYIGKMLINVNNIGLVNIIAGKTIVPEFIQDEAAASNIAEEISDILANSSKMDKIKQELSRVRGNLGSPGAAARTARLVCEMIGKR
ncbi:MAG: lipid-A-disaccharide synthase [Thermodesulfobacteriota bacterium]|nr:lipid-A-disaccharide synthase [Thermodesulfobacteriota bacterium]